MAHDPSYDCRQCGAHFDSQDGLNRHTRESHATQPSSASPSQPSSASPSQQSPPNQPKQSPSRGNDSSKL